MEPITNFVYLIFLVLAGYLGGELVAKINLPKVLGYLIAGMLLGPFALGLIDQSALDNNLMKTFLLISIGLVGYMVGAGIHLKELKKAGSSTFIISVFEAYTPFIFVALASYFIFGWDLMTSLVVGSIALATAPAMALSISQEYKTDGPVTRTLLPIVAIDDVLAVVTFGVILAFAGSHYSGIEASFVEPFIEILISVALGVLAGFIGYQVFRHITNQTILLLTAVIVILVTMFVALALHAELFMVGIAFGITVVNLFTKQEQARFTASTQKISDIAMITFMVIIGSTLDITALFSVVALIGAIIYMVARAGGKIGGSALGAKLSKAPKTVQKYLGYTLLPAAGISLTFVGLATPVLPTEYAQVIGVVIASAALINEIIAVFAIKWAFAKSGEVGKAK